MERAGAKLSLGGMTVRAEHLNLVFRREVVANQPSKQPTGSGSVAGKFFPKLATIFVNMIKFKKDFVSLATTSANAAIMIKALFTDALPISLIIMSLSRLFVFSRIDSVAGTTNTRKPISILGLPFEASILRSVFVSMRTMGFQFVSVRHSYTTSIAKTRRK